MCKPDLTVLFNQNGGKSNYTIDRNIELTTLALFVVISG